METMTVQEAAKHFGVSHQNIKYWVRNGILEGESIDGDWIIYIPDEDTHKHQDEDTRTLDELLKQISEASIQRAADYFRVETEAIERWIRHGILDAEVMGEHWLVRSPEMETGNLGGGHGVSEGKGVTDKGNIVSLWHGTTERRARAILENGFKPPTRGGKIWFTERFSLARTVAVRKSQARNEKPIIFSCEIDLERHSWYERRAEGVFVFYSPIDTDVIRYVSHLERGRLPKQVKARKRKGMSKGIDIAVTQVGGRFGVWAWMNAFLELEGKPTVSEDYPAVDEVWRWVEAQYTEGRDDPISDMEMLIQVTKVAEII